MAKPITSGAPGTAVPGAGVVATKPGMAAEVYIQTQSRTALQYIMRPIHDSLLRAFREV